MHTNWLGLWKQEREGFYAGQVIKKSEIPKYTRIVLRYNKYYEKDGNRPRFVYCFADSDGYREKCVPIEIVDEEEEAERLYTYEEVQRICAQVGADLGRELAREQAYKKESD